MKILGTGLNGLIGSRIVELLSPKYSFENLSRSNGVDITDFSLVYNAISSSNAEIVLHIAAFTDVKVAEAEKELGKESQAWKINVIGTQNVAKACLEANKKLIHFSTDLVLGGDKTPDGGFKEDDNPNPLSFYAQTKYEGEKFVNNLKTPWIIVRTAYPYRKEFVKPDFVRFFKQTLFDGKRVSVLTDRIVTPTFIDDIANALDVLIEKNSNGIYHVVGSQEISMYDAVNLIANTFGLDSSLIEKITRSEFLVGRPPEPFSSALNNDKIRKLGVNMKSFEEGLLEIKKQMTIEDKQ